MIVGPGGFADRFSRGRYDQDAIEEFLINLTFVDGLDYLEFADRLTILIEVDGDKFPLIIFDASEQKCVIRPGAVGTFFVDEVLQSPRRARRNGDARRRVHHQPFPR